MPLIYIFPEETGPIHLICVLHECPQPQLGTSFFHNVLPPLSPPLSHSTLSDNDLSSKTYLNAFLFIFRGKEDKTVMSVYPRWKAFPVYSCIYLAHRRLLCLSFVFFFQDVLSATRESHRLWITQCGRSESWTGVSWFKPGELLYPLLKGCGMYL